MDIEIVYCLAVKEGEDVYFAGAPLELVAHGTREKAERMEGSLEFFDFLNPYCYSLSFEWTRAVALGIIEEQLQPKVIKLLVDLDDTERISVLEVYSLEDLKNIE